MYKFIQISHDILIQCHGDYMKMKKFNYMFGIDILRNSSQIFWGVLRSAFEGFGCPKRHPDALLAKTMPQSMYSYYAVLSDSNFIKIVIIKASHITKILQ